MTSISVVAVCLAVLMVGMATVPAGARAPFPAQAGPPVLTSVSLVSVRGVRPEANGLFGGLLVTMNVEGAGEGLVQASASLRSADGRVYITSNETWATFNASAGLATLPFFAELAGPAIRASGIDGPYDLYLFARGWTLDSTPSQLYVTNTTNTTAFHATDFAPFSADTAGPPTAEGIDPDRDGLFDALVVRVPLSVVAAGPVAVWGSLTVGTLNVAGSSDSRARYLVPGPYAWDLVFDGMEIRQSGLDSPYTLGVYIQFPYLDRGYGYPQITRTFTIATYPSVRFEPQSATLRGPVTSSLASLGPGDLHGLEVIHVPLHVRSAGDYAVTAIPFVPYWALIPPGVFRFPNTEADRYLALPMGDTVVDLEFSSLVLSRLPPGGNFSLLIQVQRIGGDPWDGQAVLWTEHNVTGAILPQRPLAVVNITATGPAGACTDVEGYALDAAAHFLFRNQSGFLPPTLPPPVLRLDLYPGTFTLFLRGCGRESVQTLTVSGSEDLTIPIPDMPAVPPDRYVVSLPSWNESVTTGTLSLLSGPRARFFGDFGGNLDGSADAGELSRYLAACCVYPFYLGLATLDGSNDWPLTATLTGVVGADRVTASEPITAYTRYDSPLAVPPLAGPHHLVSMDMYYTSPYSAPYTVQVNLPPGATGYLSMSATWTYQSNLSAPVNISATRLGPGSWLLTPGNAPTGYEFSWPTVTIDAIGGPTAPSGTNGVGSATVILPLLVAAVTGFAVVAAVLLVSWRPRRRA